MNKVTLERLLWSIAFPGFGQLLNHKILKSLLFILMEMVINRQSNFNLAIISSFNGHFDKATEYIHFQWLMFYPCLYFFAMWDAVRDTYKEGSTPPYAFLPYVSCTIFVTIGLIYSQRWTLFGILIGPIFMPILCVIPGLAVGLAAKAWLLKNRSNH
ncbi:MULTISPECIES: hypothetical protein [Bacillaceae]|uniref:hypothetical protein n=1 Tax=Bacillaceae TaxID=186817 RepID=UPI001E400A76|nr:MULTISPECIES: hypothetical protein [Bacillaceae]MCE4050842.1 hypothetical protein [Bacillus sp. Au-Bac7]MCM3029296.1 hypothetical protein [Niallia sp. MER 6]MDL0436474.1 hypothetical protein [Niallia sp. SS-2023]UPO88634.1 hypothetical protein L8T27_005560 [Niallia sp. Man26]